MWSRKIKRLIDNSSFFHPRGAFYLDNEEDVLKRDTTGATLEDRFDKTVSLLIFNRFWNKSVFSHAFLPPGAAEGYASEELWSVVTDEIHTSGWPGDKIYDIHCWLWTSFLKKSIQDTTAFDAAWAQESASNSKFINQHAGGMRQVFARPAAKNT